jgi:hypothetical protein
LVSHSVYTVLFPEVVLDEKNAEFVGPRPDLQMCTPCQKLASNEVLRRPEQSRVAACSQSVQWLFMNSADLVIPEIAYCNE